MYTLILTTFERMQLLAWLNRQSGDIGYIRRALDLVNKLELNPEEKALVGWREEAGQLQWHDASREFQISMTEAELRILQPALQAQWPVNKLILAMLDKLELALSAN